MLKISDFFKKIQNKHTQELFIRSIIQSALKSCAGIDVTIESIGINSGTVTLKGISQSERSQIFIKKHKIIEAINIGQTIRKVTDMR
jgi:hypothetical protein